MAFARVENKISDHQKIKILANKLEEVANKTISQFEKIMNSDGGYINDSATDLACYFKLPMMFLYSEKNEHAKKVLSYIKSHFLMKDGDFKTKVGAKSVKPEYSEYYTYMNGWITRAANITGDERMKHSAYLFMQSFYTSDRFFLTNKLCHQSDVLTVAHQGLLNLEIGNKKIAITAGDTLIHILEQQKNLEESFYLRFDEDNKLALDFKSDVAMLYCVNTKQPNQLYFMIGYPCAYLAILYKATGEEKYLATAKKYFDFALTCGSNIYESTFSHKIAWAASILFKITGEEKYLQAINKITNYFISIQDKDGLWFASEGPSISLDQSAEIVCWFTNIKDNLNNFLKLHLLSLEHTEADVEISSNFKI